MFRSFIKEIVLKLEETVYGARISVTFHLMFVHVNFSSASVAEWRPFGKNLLTLLGSAVAQW